MTGLMVGKVLGNSPTHRLVTIVSAFSSRQRRRSETPTGFVGCPPIYIGSLLPRGERARGSPRTARNNKDRAHMAGPSLVTRSATASELYRRLDVSGQFQAWHVDR